MEIITTSTAGNTTGYTKKKIKLETFPPEFKVEQYATYEVGSGKVKVDMYGEEFSGGGTLAAALLSKEKNVEVECNGIKVQCKKQGKFVEGIFPKALVEKVTRLNKDLIRVKMHGITHLITDKKSLLENGLYKRLVDQEDDLCVGIILFDGKNFVPRIFIKELGTIVFEMACTSGSIAVYEVFGAEKIKQPSGEVIEIKKDGDYFVKAKCEILKRGNINMD